MVSVAGPALEMVHTVVCPGTTGKVPPDVRSSLLPAPVVGSRVSQVIDVSRQPDGTAGSVSR